MAWCNNSLKAGKGKIMDCKKYMFIDTFPSLFGFLQGRTSRASHAALRGTVPVRDETPVQWPRREGGDPARGPSRLHLATVRLGNGNKTPVVLSDKIPLRREGCAPRAGGHGSVPCASTRCWGCGDVRM